MNTITQRESLEEASDEILAVMGVERPFMHDNLMEGRRAVIVADSVENGDRIHALLVEAGLSAQRLAVDTPLDVEDDGISPQVRRGDIVVIDSASFDAVHDRMLTERMGPSCVAISDLIHSTNYGADDVALLVSHEDAMQDALRVLTLMTTRFADRVAEIGEFSRRDRAMASLFGDDVIAAERRRSIVLMDEGRDFGRMAGIALKMVASEKSDHSPRFDNDGWNRRQGRGKSNMRGHGKGRR